MGGGGGGDKLNFLLAVEQVVPGPHLYSIGFLAHGLVLKLPVDNLTTYFSFPLQVQCCGSVGNDLVQIRILLFRIRILPFNQAN